MSNVYWYRYTKFSCVANRAYHTAMLAVYMLPMSGWHWKMPVMLTPVVAKDVQFGW